MGRVGVIPSGRVSRRAFLGCSAAAGLALAQSAEAASSSIRLGMIGAGNRGTALLRTLLELPGVAVTAVADVDPRHRARAQGIAEKAQGTRPEGVESWDTLCGRPDLDGVVIALPCDLHADAACAAIEAGLPVYAEKPLAHSLDDCDRILEASGRAPAVPIRVGFQRRWHPRYRDGVELIRRGELGELVEGRASWSSSNGPVSGHGGWLARRERSGDWMVEQAVHVWDVFRWIKGENPVRAFGSGRRGLFASIDPGRDVTDHYSAVLEWADGFQVTFIQSWTDPADDAFTGVSLKVIGTEGGMDFATGTATFRDRARPRRSLSPGVWPDTKLALQEFVEVVRKPDQSAPGPQTLAEARDATRIGLMVRRAIDERRVVALDEIG